MGSDGVLSLAPPVGFSRQLSVRAGPSELVAALLSWFGSAAGRLAAGVPAGAPVVLGGSGVLVRTGAAAGPTGGTGPGRSSSLRFPDVAGPAGSVSELVEQHKPPGSGSLLAAVSQR